MTSKSPLPSVGILFHIYTTFITTMIFIMVVIVPSTHAQNIELTYRIEEELAPMTVIGHIVQDSNIGDFVAPDDIGDLRFSFLTQGNPYISYIWVNSTTGKLRTFSRIDRENLCQRVLTTCQFQVEAAVQAQIGTFFMVVVINIQVIDINDNSPTFDPPTLNLQISEDESVGTRFRLPSASDPDTGEDFSVVAYDLSNLNVVPGLDSYFSLTVDGHSSSDFSVHLRLEKALDREVTSSYSYLLEAKDGGNPSSTGTLTVNVQISDVNDNPPVFDYATYVANISEITAVNKDILTVRATDQDAGVNGEMVYSMPPVQVDPVVFSMFAINKTNGRIKTKIPLDPYAGGSYSFQVVARDSGNTPLTATTEVTIRIKDTHNSDPEILLNVFGETGMAQVSEMAELGRTVAYVAVSDPDSSLTPNGIVTCSVDSGQFELQAIDVDKYKVILTRQLDREDAAFHSVTVFCEDSGSPPLNSSTSFVVEVIDENDNPPIFESTLYAIEVEEGTRGSDRNAIVQVRAIDDDIGSNADITYRLADNSDSDFGIYTDGSIVVTNPDGLDREEPVKGQIREFVVLAVDGGKQALTGTTRVKVTIADINDNAPQFSEPAYYFSVLENSPVGTVVNNVTANDADSAANGLIKFKMDPTDENSVPFRVSSKGSVTVSGPLDREKVSKYQFQLVAYDIDQPALLSSSVIVNMHVTDVNDNRPVFTFPNDSNRTLYIPHTLSANTGFGHIVAKDLDIGKNGQLRYSRDSGNGTKYVDILPDTGEIVLIRSLTMKDMGSHFLTVAVHDLGSREQLATQSTLQIVIYEGNATVALKNESEGFRNIVVVVVLVVVTVSLGLAILLTIVLIQRIDKQRRRYHAKEEEAKVDSNLRHLNPVLGVDVIESATDLSDVTSGDPKADGGKKKKEVSFSLDEDNNVSQSSGSGILTSFGTGSASSSDKYDAIPERERGRLKGDMLLISNHNHLQSKDDHSGHKMTKKDLNTLTSFYQVNPSSSSGASYSARQEQPPHHHDDNLSDISADVSTSDSGRGGSDVELQSHGGNSKDSGNQHNNLNAGGASNNSSNMTRNISNSNSSISNTNSLNYSARNLSNKSVHFQNIRPEPLSSFRSSSSVPSYPPGPHHPQRPLNNANGQNHPANMHQDAANRYTPNIYVGNDDEGSYVKLANRSDGSSNPINQDLNKFRDPNTDTARYPSSSSRYNPRTFFPTNEDNEYVDMAGVRGSFLRPRTSSNQCLEGAATASSASVGWDGDTTTSGSYTVDPHELCEEIDKLFFEEVQDVVV